MTPKVPFTSGGAYGSRAPHGAVRHSSLSGQMRGSERGDQFAFDSSRLLTRGRGVVPAVAGPARGRRGDEAPDLPVLLPPRLFFPARTSDLGPRAVIDNPALETPLPCRGSPGRTRPRYHPDRLPHLVPLPRETRASTGAELDATVPPGRRPP